MPKIPASVARNEYHDRLIAAGFQLLHTGKVRETYWRPGEDWLLVIATDRVSIFDLVMPFSMDRKGQFLVAYTVLWLTRVLNIDHHLMAYGYDVDAYLPTATLRGNPGLQKRAIVVSKQKVIPIECVVRGYLTGSGEKEYRKVGSVCGNPLPVGLFDGSRLTEPIFTPTTKEAEGHDQPVDFRSVSPELAARSIDVYKQGAQYALERGVVIADTKFEWASNLSRLAGLILVDEVLTPDSSRFWLEEEWKECITRRQSPPSHDKQLIRNWGKSVETLWGTGLDCLDPEKEGLDPVIRDAQYTFIDQLEPPTEVLRLTGERYEAMFQRLSGGYSLESFQSNIMGI